MPSNIEDQLAKLAELEEIEAEATQKIEAEEKIKAAKRNNSSLSIHYKAMRVAQVQRARARKKELQLLLAKDYGIVESKKYRKARSSVIIKKPIEAIDRFKRIEAKT